MRPTQITRATVEPFNIALPRPFETAAARRTAAHNVLLTLELAGGAQGTGEVAPAPHVTGEDQADTLRRLEAFAGALVGQDVARYRALSEAFRRAYPEAPAARAGLESALLDAYCRHLGVPLFHFLGGATAELRTDVTVPIVAPAEAEEVARQAVAQGFTDLKVKVGAGNHDFERTLAVARAAPGVPIRLDGNQGFTPEGAVAFLRRVLDAGVTVALYEQPVPREDLAGMRFVRERVSVPVAADESVIHPEDAYRVAQAGAADVVNLKLMKSGVLGALAIAGLCRAAGLRLMLGCMLESRLGISVAAHLAAGLGGFDFLDLDGHLLTGDTCASGGFSQTGSRLSLSPDLPGHAATRV
ncbi:MAG: dipeptide epimerase [Armatimonadetes bacterium]|jgi:L-alanine-DL-glutamate epimerase-like enolase superfamily enzyme|nr:dipeptide epimerase [Armatimonadota bacterium]